MKLFSLDIDITSGKRVEEYIIVHRYWQPDLVLGKGLTRSMIILLNGSSNARIGCKLASGIVFLDFPTI